MSPNVKPRIVTATATNFRAVDANDRRFYAIATVVSGLLWFEIVAKVANRDRGSVSGKELFAAMMSHFGSKIKIIEGNWNAVGGLVDNLDQFNRAVAAGLSQEDAAALTWTGLRASECGFNRITIEYANASMGKFDEVRVHFRR